MQTSLYKLATIIYKNEPTYEYIYRSNNKINELYLITEKYKKMKNLFILILLTCIISQFSCGNKNCCQTETKVNNQEYLKSWNNEAKQAIIDYVNDVTNPNSSNFIPICDRIATFDNDGTLWSEQPVPSQIFFAIDEIKRMAGSHPEWKDTEPYKSAIDNNLEAIINQGKEALVELLLASHSGMTSDEYTQNVKNWIATAKHPIKNKLYTELVYQPMLELLDYLRANNFKTFIVSGGSVSFMRAWAEKAYGIPSDQIVGSYFSAEFDYNNGKANVIRKPNLELLDDKALKPVAIDRFIGKRPVFAGGNSDGDLQMLQYADGNVYKTFKLFINHTDGEREFLYDEKTLSGTLVEGMKDAIEKKWNVVDMAKDWKVVYPSELKK